MRCSVFDQSSSNLYICRGTIWFPFSSCFHRRRMIHNRHFNSLMRKGGTRLRKGKVIYTPIWHFYDFLYETNFLLKNETSIWRTMRERLIDKWIQIASASNYITWLPNLPRESSAQESSSPEAAYSHALALHDCHSISSTIPSALYYRPPPTQFPLFPVLSHLSLPDHLPRRLIVRFISAKLAPIPA